MWSKLYSDFKTAYFINKFKPSGSAAGQASCEHYETLMFLEGQVDHRTHSTTATIKSKSSWKRPIKSHPQSVKKVPQIDKAAEIKLKHKDRAVEALEESKEVLKTVNNNLAKMLSPQSVEGNLFYENMSLVKVQNRNECFQEILETIDKFDTNSN